MANERDLEATDYQALAEIRFQIRQFLHFSEQAARAAGIEPQQHQALLAIKGVADGVAPTVGEVARRLQIEQNSAVELLDRLQAQGYIQRRKNANDRRSVVLSLLPKGERVLRDLTVAHRNELQASGAHLIAALRRAMAGTPARKPAIRATRKEKVSAQPTKVR